MRALGRFFLVLLIVLVGLGALATVALRVGHGKFAPPSEVKPGFQEVKNAFMVSLFAARTAPGPHVVLFDAGMDPMARPIDALLASLGAKRDDVTDVFLTHGHFDHIAGAPALTKARIHIGAADAPLAAGQVRPEALAPMLLTKMAGNPTVTADAPIAGAASFPVGSSDPSKVVKAFPVPGHTPGSYVYLYDGVLVAGDIMVLKQGRLDVTPRLANPHPEQNRASIVALKNALANETVDIVCTAHGGCTPKGLGKLLLDDLVTRL
jgi:glyoxylase-like metal-dependent hydrolase (beta-lactamase superfamily II)